MEWSEADSSVDDWPGQCREDYDSLQTQVERSGLYNSHYRVQCGEYHLQESLDDDLGRGRPAQNTNPLEVLLSGNSGLLYCYARGFPCEFVGPDLCG